MTEELGGKHWGDFSREAEIEKMVEKPDWLDRRLIHVLRVMYEPSYSESFLQSINPLNLWALPLWEFRYIYRAIKKSGRRDA